MLGWLRSRYLLYRFRRRRRDGRAIRLRVADVGQLFRDFDAAGVDHVVLRWFDEVPLTPAEHRSFEGDVDVLVRDHDGAAIARAAARQPGPVVVELRSVTGRLGSYAGMPYLPPAFALDVLASRARHARGFWVPSPELQLPVLLFHLCYHKAEASGIPTGVDLPTGTGKRDYAGKTLAFARSLGRPLPEPLTLEVLRRELVAADRDLRLDLLVRWPGDSAWIRHLTGRERRRHRDAARRLPGIGVFILRSDLPRSWEEKLVELLESEFEVIEHGVLDEPARERVARHVRGGNWEIRPGYPDAGPRGFLIVRRRASDGKDPVAVKRRFRTEIRQRARQAGVRFRHGLHGSDGPLEAVHMLRTIWGRDGDDEIDVLASLCVRDGDVDERLAAVDERVPGEPDHDSV